jgi:branched-chain amino acid aminotransferase
MGFDVVEKDLTLDELFDSDEAFFTGTAVEITPISKIDKKVIGIGSRGPITEKLQKTYNDIIFGKNKNYDHWLSLVSS